MDTGSGQRRRSLRGALSEGRASAPDQRRAEKSRYDPRAMPHGISEFAQIALPVAVHGEFTYSIPLDLRDGVRLGSRVEVPLGPKLTTGFVVGLTERAPDGDVKVRPIRSV